MTEVPTPAMMRPRATDPVPAPEAALVAASAWGRAEADGSVYRRTPEGEVLVGQYTIGTPAEGLAFYARKFVDLQVEAELLVTRVRDGKAPLEPARAALTRLRESAAAASFVGDASSLESLINDVAAAIDEAAERAAERKAADRAAAKVVREKLVAEAESLSQSTQWKSTTERYAAIVEEWKALPRADRASEQELWKRLSAARTHFDKARRAHFAALDGQRKEALTAKRALISQAEALASTTDWPATTKKLRSLMDEWKRAPRGSRADEDKLWKRFKAANDAFYAAMKADQDTKEAELAVNVPAKEALVVEAEALSLSDLASAKKALRAIQNRWDAAGDLPRAERQRLEKRLAKVEDAVRNAERESWQRSNPEVKARAESTANAFSDALARMREQLSAAESRGDAARAAELQQQIASTEALLSAAKEHA